jgi:hypothetical protein
MFVLDSVVLSELRKPPQQRNRNLLRWIGEVPSADLLSAWRPGVLPLV